MKIEVKFLIILPFCAGSEITESEAKAVCPPRFITEMYLRPSVNYAQNTFFRQFVDHLTRPPIQDVDRRLVFPFLPEFTTIILPGLKKIERLRPFVQLGFLLRVTAKAVWSY